MRSWAFVAEAADELADAVRWYEEQEEGVGARFDNVVRDTLDALCQGRIATGPVPGASARSPIRRVLVPKFPFALIVEETPERVLVLAVAHAKRRPGYWRSRAARR